MTDFQLRVDALYADATLSDADRIREIDALAADRGAHDAIALLERAGARDSAGLEEEAEPLYRSALAAGLTGALRTQALIQLASTLRNLGRAEESLVLLDEAEDVDDGELSDAIEAFRALSLVSAGDPVRGASIALATLAPHLPMYGRAVGAYARELPATDA